MRVLTYACIIAVFATVTTAEGQECNPAEHLVSDNFSYSDRLLLNLAFFRQHEERKKSASDKSTFLERYGYGQISIDEASKAAQSMREALGLTLSVDEERTILSSELSQHGVEAYRDCLASQKQNVFVHLPKYALNSEDFQARIYLRGFPTNTALPVTITLTHANLITNADKLTVSPGGSIQVAVRRDLTKDFEISATVGAPGTTQETQSARLPPALTKEMRRVTVWGDRRTFNQTTRTEADPQGGDICVYVEEGTIIAARVRRHYEKRLSGAIEEEPSKTVGNSTFLKSRCMTVRARYSGGNNSSQMCATAYIEAEALVPVSIGEKRAENPPAWLTDGTLKTCD